jgi:hypothetical protein
VRGFLSLLFGKKGALHRACSRAGGGIDGGMVSRPALCLAAIE